MAFFVYRTEYCEECDKIYIEIDVNDFSKMDFNRNIDLVIDGYISGNLILYEYNEDINIYFCDFCRKKYCRETKYSIAQETFEVILLDYYLNNIINNKNIDINILKWSKKYDNNNHTKIWKGIDYYFLKIFGYPYILRNINIDKETYKKKELLNLQFKHNIIF